MAKIDLRNAYYRGWFAARARRPTPDNARFSTRRRQEPTMTGRNDYRPAQAGTLCAIRARAEGLEKLPKQEKAPS